jgi:hypothetical protein
MTTRLRSILVFIVGGLLGSAAGFALGIFFYPYLFLADIVGAESVDNRTSRKLLARGVFIHANPRDPVHYGKGRVSIYDGLLHLESDFEVGPGPKFHVYLEIRGAFHRGGEDDVRRPRAPQGLPRRPELSDPRRRRSAQVRQRGDLVRALRRADLPRCAEAALEGPLCRAASGAADPST